MAAGEAQDISMMSEFAVWSKEPETDWCCLKTLQTFTHLRIPTWCKKILLYVHEPATLDYM